MSSSHLKTAAQQHVTKTILLLLIAIVASACTADDPRSYNPGVPTGTETPDPLLPLRPPPDASTTTPSPPVVQSLSAGGSHTCSLLAGKVRCWGLGSSGQLSYGNLDSLGATPPASAPQDIDITGEVQQVSAGDAHTCVLVEGGAVRCWGNGDYGKLGYGNTNSTGGTQPYRRAEDIALGEPATQISAGYRHTCAVLTTGAVRCWGIRSFGQLGHPEFEGNIGSNETPASVGDIDLGEQATQVAAGHFHTCALVGSGGVRCWGRDVWGQLGYGRAEDIGDNEPPASAGRISLGGPAKQVVVGAAHSCALLTSGDVRCWGYGTIGRLGYANGISIGDNETPDTADPVRLGGKATQLAAGREHTCALFENGDVRCWGLGAVSLNADGSVDRDGHGQLGYPTAEGNIGDDEHPDQVGPVALGGPAVQITAGYNHTCAVLESGAVRCWGNGADGRLGYGNTNSIGDDEAPASAGDVLFGF